MNACAARIAAAGVFCTGTLAAADANADMLVLKCSIGGQVASAPFNVDLTNRTINTGKGAVSAEVNSRALSWREEGVLRTINRDTYAMFRQLPDGSFFQIGTCRPLEG